jgi:hypothetical protein
MCWNSSCTPLCQPWLETPESGVHEDHPGAIVTQHTPALCGAAYDDAGWHADVRGRQPWVALTGLGVLCMSTCIWVLLGRLVWRAWPRRGSFRRCFVPQCLAVLFSTVLVQSPLLFSTVLGAKPPVAAPLAASCRSSRFEPSSASALAASRQSRAGELNQVIVLLLRRMSMAECLPCIACHA